MQEGIDVLLAERPIQRVFTAYTRGVDRFNGGGGFADSYVRGIRSPDDIVYRILDGSRG